MFYCGEIGYKLNWVHILERVVNMLIIGECLSSYDEVDMLVGHISSRISVLEDIYPKSTIFHIEFCLRELLNNAVEHGNRFDQRKKIQCIFHHTGGEILISVWDEGPEFDIDQTLRAIDHEDIGRCRFRGLSTLRMLGFNLEYRDGWMTAIMYI